MKFKAIAGLLLIIGIISINAQDKGHYFQINGGVGLHNLQYDLPNGSVKNNIGFTGNFEYSYFFTNNWGIGTGLGIQTYKASSTINYLEEISSTDIDGESYQYRTYFNDWEETQNLLFLDIPIGVKFQNKINSKWKFFSGLGGKISLPISATYEITGGSIETRGYYPQYDAELFGMSQHGFDTYTSFPNGDININPAYSAFLDLGALYALNNKLDLYLGAYLNYGLNNIIDESDAMILTEDKVYSNTFESNQTDKVIPISFGVKVGISMHKKTKECKIKPQRMQKISSNRTAAPPKPKKQEPKEVKEPAKPRQKYVIPEFVDPMEEAYVEAKKVSAATDIKFELGNDSVVGDPQEDKLKKLAELLLENPQMKLHIIGHTCDIDSHDKNVRIGLDRAFAIRNKLLDYGVPEYQMTVESKAYDEPLVPNTSDENRARNRRVQLIIEK